MNGPEVVPRRYCTSQWTPTEQAIAAARAAVEGLPADVRLTDASVLLGEAQAAVADWIDEKQPVARRRVVVDLPGLAVAVGGELVDAGRRVFALTGGRVIDLEGLAHRLVQLHNLCSDSGRLVLLEALDLVEELRDGRPQAAAQAAPVPAAGILPYGSHTCRACGASPRLGIHPKLCYAAGCPCAAGVPGSSSMPGQAGGPFPGHLHLTCGRCGFGWTTALLGEADEPLTGTGPDAIGPMLANVGELQAALQASGEALRSAARALRDAGKPLDARLAHEAAGLALLRAERD